MDNQHRHVPGYRDWDEGTTGIIAGLKSFLNKELQERLDMVKQMLQTQLGDAVNEIQHASAALEVLAQAPIATTDEGVLEREQAHIEAQARLEVAKAKYSRVSEAQRWHAMARTDFQNGAMKLVRAVAQPTTEY